ncbi:hypothetical protein QBC38DRAFT_216294 [Podospora fimiseda]|uniref:DUF6536 domain-containing protein n=1 Tax=Podospora fimiseda TaxID=252190 RepID=A0AAN7BNZ3_9PEZI|nr:hypothetical protein QBC38DRAFT_216294 [Podospora fimiseda]
MARYKLISQKSPLSQQPWKISVLAFSCFAFVVFLVNFAYSICVTIFAAKQKTLVAMVTELQCSSVKAIDKIIHVLINLLSTVLVSGSSYTMRCIMGPTRQLVDQTHGGGLCVDIGVPRIRNFRNLCFKDKMFWLLLLTSSLPLNMFYNSAIYSSKAANSSYYALSVPEWYVESLSNETMNAIPANLPVWPLLEAYKGDKLAKLDAYTCLDTYGNLL